MANFSFLQLVCFIVFIFIIICQHGAADEESKASYIFVVLRSHSSDFILLCILEWDRHHISPYIRPFNL